MLGKLIKHEFKATGRNFIPLYIAIILVSFLSGFMLDSFSDNSNVNMIRFIPVMILFALYVALGVLTLVVIIQRFNKNLLGDEGYLMFTLPVTSKKLILSKVIVSITWYFVSLIVSMFSGAIVVFTMLIKSAEPVKLEFDKIMDEFFRIIAGIQKIEMLADVLNVVLLMLLAFGVFVLLIYLSIAIGQLSIFSKHKTIISFIAIFVISIMINIIGNIFMEINPDIFGSLLMNYLSLILINVVAFFGTTYILDNKLNLE